ncbi:MAG: hypothetical protein AB7K09_11095 [Planctomycetota bacterium]
MKGPNESGTHNRPEIDLLMAAAETVSSPLDVALDRVRSLPGGATRKEVSDALATLAEAAADIDGIQLAALRSEATRALKVAGVHSPGRLVTAALPGGSNGQRRESAAKRLLSLVSEEGAELWHDTQREPHISFPKDDHVEHYRLRTPPVREWLAWLLYRRSGAVPGGDAVESTLNVLSAKAAHDGTTHPVAVRRHHDGSAFWLDLGTPDWSAVKVTPDGWIVEPVPDVRFTRPKGLLPLPLPAAGGSLDELRQLINVADEHWPLVCGWVVGALAPGGPFPALLLTGLQGSGKSGATRLLRQLLDPNSAPVRSAPRDERDLAIAARNGAVVALDNVSRVPDWLSDALCRLTTGAGMTTRALFSDDHEAIFAACRPVVLNGIADVATRPDLLDRSIRVQLRPIQVRGETPIDGGKRRVTESEIMEVFGVAHPRLLGALLDAVACGLRRLPETVLDDPPRMADHARWVVACEPALPIPAGSYLAAWDAGVGSMHEVSMDASVVGSVLRAWFANKREWRGTSSELLDELNRQREDRPPKGWPSQPNSLSSELNRLAPSLRGVGIMLKRGEGSTAQRRLWTITRVDEGTGA